MDREVTELTCQLLHTVYPTPPHLPALVDTEGVLNTPLHHYESCPARMVRDCVVISHTSRVLAAYRDIVLGAEQ